jgi:hypothetical protein
MEILTNFRTKQLNMETNLEEEFKNHKVYNLKTKLTVKKM